MTCTPCSLMLPIAIGALLISQGNVVLGVAAAVIGIALNLWISARTGRSACAPTTDAAKPADPRFRTVPTDLTTSPRR